MTDKSMDISVILTAPEYDGAALRRRLEPVLAQTADAMEFIVTCRDAKAQGFEGLANDGREIRFLEGFGPEDTGRARNAAINAANGRFLYFWDGGLGCPRGLLADALTLADETQADIAAWNIMETDASGSTYRTCVRTDYFNADLAKATRRDCPERILRVLSPALPAKLFRASFIKDNNITFAETAACSEYGFSALAAACGASIAPMIFGSADCEKPAPAPAADLSQVIDETLARIKALPYYKSVALAARQFAACTLLEELAAAFDGGREGDAGTRELFNYAHELFNGPDYADIDLREWETDKAQAQFLCVKNRDYDGLLESRKKRIVASFTSYPARIGSCAAVVRNLLAQSRRPDLIVLYLCEGEFPEGRESLPTELTALEKDGSLEIRFVPVNLKPHKKYFYAFRDFPEDPIVTVDDDLSYQKNMIEMLRLSYIAFPGAVSSVRTHYPMQGEGGGIGPYADWLSAADGCLHTPSMRLVATGGAGALYPPGLLRTNLLTEELIMQTAPNADDLFLKGLELISGVPVVLAVDDTSLHILANTQETALWLTNRDQNDAQMAAVLAWVDSERGSGYTVKTLFSAFSADEPDGAAGMLRGTVFIAQRRQRATQWILNTAWREKKAFAKRCYAAEDSNAKLSEAAENALKETEEARAAEKRGLRRLFGK